MSVEALHFRKDNVTGYFYPSDIKDHPLPDLIRNDWTKLNSMIENKYMVEYLKVCAYYNKVFPSLKSYDWSHSSHNAMAFTIFDQERSDTGTGISANYLKSVIDTVTARISNITFDVSLSSDEPLLNLELYKSTAERYIKQQINTYRLEHVVSECFHDAAILGYSHLFMDPFTRQIRKINDWEFASFESEFNTGKLRRVLIRDFMFNSLDLAPYVANYDQKDKITEWLKRPAVDMKMYIDCMAHTATITIDATTLPPIEYPFDEVLLSTYSWDIGIKRTMVASLFDQLFALQREMNKLMAKQTQLLTNYKGPVPVFSTQDSDAVLKAINNSAGEALFIDSRSTSEFMTVINPMPLDPALAAEVERLKAQMFEIAGVQEISMDMENYRSAAAVIALDQMRDKKYQNQLFLLSEFVVDTVKMIMKFQQDGIEGVDWDALNNLIEQAYVDVKITHNNAADNANPAPQPIDYDVLNTDRFVLDVLYGRKTYDDIDYTINRETVVGLVCTKLIKLRWLGEDTSFAETFAIDAFIDAVKNGAVQLG